MVQCKLWLPAVLASALALSGFAGEQREILRAKDLSPVSSVHETAGAGVPLLRAGKVLLPVVLAKKTTRFHARAAAFLCEVLNEMSGGKAEIVKSDVKLETPAIYIGNFDFMKNAGMNAEGMANGEFAVRTLDGSLYLYGNDTGRQSNGSANAVYDFAERILGMRQYFDAKSGGRSVGKQSDFTIPPLYYGDKPVFTKRDLWPYEEKTGYETYRIADGHDVRLIVHAPYSWRKDYIETHPELFQQDKDGVPTRTHMLCYGNPATLRTYLERIDEELAGGRKSGVMSGKSVTVSPDDMGVDCRCKYCRALFDEKAGPSGSASKIMVSFVRKLSDALAKSHPDLTVVFLPYLNYCDVPEGAEFPAGNVEVQLCTMPGLAMLKDPRVKEHEENLILAWEKVTKRPVQNWHYICWPAEFTSAPYVYADACVRHYRDMKGHIVGSFINGPYPEARHLLSAYVWCRALWNPEISAEDVFDVFAERMYGPASKPMRRIIELQAEGWKRPWEVAKVSPKNIFEVSYPRKEVEEMERCFAEAYRLAGADAKIKQRIDYYRSGFDAFFKESAEYASGIAFAPLMMQKVASNPVVDGKLDDPQWKSAEALPFLRATDKKVRECKYPTSLRAVWTPDGVTFGFRMTEPVPDRLFVADPAGSWFNDNVELFFDVTGKGAGDYFQIILDAKNAGLLTLRGSDVWKAPGIKSDISKGDGFWSAEIFIPFELFRNVPGAQLPKTSSAGLFWIGNFTRHRVADSGWKKDKTPGSVSEMQRLNTRYSSWSADQSAFGNLKFKE